MRCFFVQYLHGWQRYNEAVSYALREPKYRNKVRITAHFIYSKARILIYGHFFLLGFEHCAARRSFKWGQKEETTEGKTGPIKVTEDILSFTLKNKGTSVLL